MGIKAALSKPFARYITGKIRKWKNNPHQTQEKVFKELIHQGRKTAFGRDHGFDDIATYEDFKARVPVRDYEGLKEYFERVKAGERDVLWPGLPIYLSKTSGTTSGAKYIPITGDSIHNHIESARNAILCYIAETGKTDFVNGKMIFLQGSPELDESGPIPIGRLSGIVAHHVPGYLQRNRLPSFDINCIDDWEEKVRAIADETLEHDMRLISGIPPWVQMYFDILIEKSEKNEVKDIFQNFSLFIYGGVNFEPYRQQFEKTIGRKIDAIELYPASEGFIAYQDAQNEEGLLLNLDSGLFFEFIPADRFGDESAPRLGLKEVELGVNYAIILNNNAGLWGYNIGDTVKFVSLDPFRIVVSGRIKHFTSAFGEHVIADEVDGALKVACQQFNAEVTEFHVAPQVTPPEGDLPFHEWFIEFAQPPADMQAFASAIDSAMQNRNTYYRDLIEGNVLQPVKITTMTTGAFNNYMKSQGKLGGQNKLPRLANDRKLADALMTSNTNA